MKNTQSLTKIGLALTGCNPMVTLREIAENFPVRLLASTQFVLLSGEVDETAPKLMKICDLRMQMNKLSTVIIRQIDILIAFENEITDLALSMNTPVWLLKPHGNLPSCQSARFENNENVSTFYRIDKETWGDVFRKISFFRLLYPEFLNFQSISEEITLVTQDKPVEIACIANTTNDLANIFSRANADFLQVNIETTSICNLTCSYCPNSSVPRYKGLMAEDTFCKIIDSVWDYNKNYDGIIAPHLYGEPLLDQRLEQFIAYSRWRLPKASIHLFSNGEKLTVNRYLALKNAGVDLFHISMHRQESQPDIMMILDSIRIQYPELYAVEFNTGYNGEEMMNRGGLVDVTVMPIMDKHFARCACYRDLVFDVHGNVILCCNDYLGAHKFGNINQASVKEIWTSPTNSKIRNALLLGYLPLSICRKCMNIVTDSSGCQSD